MQGAGGRGLSSARGGENAQGKRPLAATRFNGNALQRQRAALCEARHTHAERLIAKKGGERWPHRVADQERHTPRRHGVHQPPAGVGAVATWQRTEVGMQHTLGGGGSEPLAVSTSEQQTASSRQQQRAADSSSEQRQQQRAAATANCASTREEMRHALWSNDSLGAKPRRAKPRRAALRATLRAALRMQSGLPGRPPQRCRACARPCCSSRAVRGASVPPHPAPSALTEEWE